MSNKDWVDVMGWCGVLNWVVGCAKQQRGVTGMTGQWAMDQSSRSLSLQLQLLGGGGWHKKS